MAERGGKDRGRGNRGRGGPGGDGRGRGRGAAAAGSGGQGQALGGRGGLPGGTFRGDHRGRYRGAGAGGGGGERGRGVGRGGGRGDGGRGRGFSGPSGPAIHQPVGGVPPVDPKVQRAEDAFQSALTLGKLSLTDAQFPARPAYATKGKKVVLFANYVELLVKPELVLHRYAIGIKPEAVGKKAVRIVHLLLEDATFTSEDVVTDFRSSLLSRNKLDDREVDVVYRPDGEDEPKANATVYKVRVFHTNTLSMNSLIEYVTSTSAPSNYADKFPAIQALNIFLNHYSKSAGNLATIGKSKTFSLSANAATMDLSRGLQVIRGFFGSVRAATARILVNVNVAYGAFYRPGALLGLMQEYGATNPHRLQAFLKSLKVSPMHLKRKKDKAGHEIVRVKNIIALATPRDGAKLDHPPRISKFAAGPKDVLFWLDDKPQTQGASTSSAAPKSKKGKKGGAKGEEGDSQPTAAKSGGGGKYISVYDFFKQTHNITLDQNYIQFPVVNVGTRDNPSYLPPQLCEVVPGQPARSKLDPNQTANMIRFAVRRPSDNAQSIVQDGITTVGLLTETNPLLSMYGMSAQPSLITVQARVRPSPQVLYNNKLVRSNQPGAWNAMNQTLSTPAKVDKWAYLVLGFKDGRERVPGGFRDQADIIPTLQAFVECLKSTGIQIGPPLKPTSRAVMLNHQDDPELETIMKECAVQRPEIVLIILPDTNMPVYDRIKHLGDVKLGIMTICCVGYNKFAKAQDQYFRNVALKVNLKLGGTNQVIEAPRLGFIGQDKTMVVGIDVTHPSPGSSDNAPSVAGMVASVDKNLGQWPAVLSVQPEARQEMVADLSGMLKSRLQLWRTLGKHVALPQNILVYRDGVSEGQYDLVREKELPLLRQACQDLYPADQTKAGLPRITVVVAGKRHQTRFYPTSEAAADRSSNCEAGTVVDRGVTEARNWDFFMQAHAPLQGTARPGHYFVVHDDIFRAQPGGAGAAAAAADMLEDITQSMCFAFGRATRAVSLVTPAYYADIVCERARCYLKALYDPDVRSDTASMVSGERSENQRPGSVAGEVQIHPNLTNRMFYI